MTKTEIRYLASVGIRQFVRDNAHHLTGRVLDYGSGLPHRCVQVQPYRHYVSGEYVPYDVGDPAPTGHFNVVLMTQVIQFIVQPMRTLALFDTDALLMTYSTCWEEVEDDDLWRFTKKGMETMLRGAGFKVHTHVPLWSTEFDDFTLVGGYGVYAIR